MTEIARGTIKIDLDDEATLAKLRAINSEFDRTMSDIDRKRATAKADLDIAPLEDAVANAKRRLKQLDAEKAEPNFNADDAEFKKKVAQARADLKRLEGEKATMELDLKGDEKVKRKIAEIEKLRERERVANEKWLERAVKLEEQAEARRLAGVRQSARVSSALRAQQAREMRQAEADAHRINDRINREAQAANQARVKEMQNLHSEALKIDKEREKAHQNEMRAIEVTSSLQRRIQAQRDQELRDLPRIQREYLELGRTLENLKTARRRAFGDTVQTERINLREAETVAKMRALHATLERVGGPVDLEVILHPGRNFGRELRSKLLSNAELKGNWARESTTAGAIVATHFARGFFDGVKSRFTKQTIAGVGTRILGRFGDILDGLSNMTVRIGPFTATLRKLGVAMAFLAPTIFDVVGALGALVSVAGAGLAGAATVGLSAVTGLGLGAVGLLFSMRNTAQEVKNVRTQINALQKAQEKYGPTAGKTVTEQRRLNTMLKQVSPLAAQTALGIEKFYTNWDKHTNTTRQNLGNVAREGFNALDKVTPQWAARTNEMSSTLNKKLGEAFNYIATTGRSKIFGRTGIMGLFNQALPSLLNGLNHVGQAFINIGQEGARYLPRAFSAFSRLSKSLLAFTQGDNFGNTVKQWVDSAQDLARFLGAAGRVLVHFFGAGVSAGRNFVQSMTQGLNSWDRFLRSAEGRNKTAQWFNQSVKGATALWHAIAPLATTFFTWAANLSPIFTQFLNGAAAIAKAVTQLIKLVGLQGPLGTLAATLGALWAVGKISAATRAVIGFSSALLGLKTAQAAIAGVGGAAALGGPGAVVRRGAVPVQNVDDRMEGMMFAAGGVATAERVAPAMTKAARATGLLRGAMTGLGSAVGFANPYVGAAIVGAAALYGAYRLLTRGARDAKKALQEGAQASGTAAQSYRDNTTSLADASSAHKQAAIDVRAARKELANAKKGTDDYKQAQLNLQSAQRQLLITGESVKNQNADRAKAAATQVRAEQQRLEAFDKLNKAQIKSFEFESKSATDDVRKQRAIEGLNKLEQQRAAMVDKVNAALNRQAAVSANTQRATAGLTPVLGQAEQKLGALARLSKTASVKVALKFDKPADVGRVAASAAASLRAGTPARIVTRIVADSSSAEQAVKRLQQARLTDKKFEIIAQGGTGAVRTLEQIAGRRLTDKEFRTIMHGGDGALLTLAKILGIKLGTKTQRIMETGSGTVIGALAKILGIRLPNKSTTVTANTGGAFGPLQSIIGLLGSIQSKTVTVTTHLVTTGSGKVLPRAKGRGPQGSEQALVGEGSNFRGATEFIANQRTGQVAKVTKPTLMNLTKDDYVIPTEAAFAARGRKLMAEFMKSQGIPGYRSSRRPKITHVKRGTNPEKVGAVVKYKDLQTDEEDLNKKITIAERKVKEPDTFLKQVSTDAEGNPIYQIDQSAVTTYRNQLEEVRKLQAQLVTGTDGSGGLMGQMIEQAGKVYKALDTYRTRRNSNIKVAERAISTNKGLLKSKDKDTVKAAKDRIKKDEATIKSERDLISQSRDVQKDISDDERDIKISRAPGYGLDLQDTLDSENSLSGLASDQLTQGNAAATSAATPAKPEPGVGEPGGPTVAEDKVSKLETEKALAQIGQGINGAAPRAMADIINDLISANQDRIKEGQSLLNDAVTSNDAEGYSIIQGAASNISSLKDEIQQMNDTNQQTAAGVIAQQSAFSSSMLDLYRNMGNNFTSTAAATAVQAASRGASAVPAAGADGANGAPGNVLAAAGGAGIVINQKFPAQPDPLTWAKATQFELNAAL